MSEPGEVQSAEQDTARIAEILSRDGVKELIQTNLDRINQLPGKNLISGITADGLVVVVREGVNKDFYANDYFQALALDATLPLVRMDQERIEANFSYKDVSRYRDGGTTRFPGHYIPDEQGKDLKNLALLPEAEALAKMGEAAFPILKFYKATGGFHYPSRLTEDRGINVKDTVGGKTLYPLPTATTTIPPSINKSL